MSLDADACGLISAFFAVGFMALFAGLYLILDVVHPRFKGPIKLERDGHKVELARFTSGEKADYCSRINSMLHCFIILPINVAQAFQIDWQWNLEPVDAAANITPLQVSLCLSAGYFIADLIFVVGFKMPMWPVFAAHHVFALIPLGTNLFSNDCRFGSTLAIGLFLLVEVTTIPLNVQTFAEQAGFAPESRLYAVSFYLTFFLWIPSRIVVPIAMDVLMIERIAMPRPFSEVACFIPGMISAFLITLFCLSVFCGLLVPAVIGRWRTDRHTPSATPVQLPLIGHVDEAGFTDAEEMLTHVP
jgi:hypothetical protein